MTIKSFLAAGGDKAWVANTSAAPAKLLRLREMSEMLWKYPWKITNLNVKVRSTITAQALNIEGNCCRV